VGRRLSRLHPLSNPYPARFWLLFAGVLFSMTCNSFIWPFATIFIAEQTQSGLSLTAFMFTIQACASGLSVGYTSKMMDLYGRKRLMVAGLVLHAGTLLLMSDATSLITWGVLMALMGVVSPLFSVGGNAMVADLLPGEQRSGAYALLRTAMNLGIVVGPMIGGWIISRYSFQTTYWSTALLLLLLAGLAGFFLRETRPQIAPRPDQARESVWKDRVFVKVLGFYTLSVMGFIEMFFLLPIYLKQHFQILEDQSSLLFSVNALIVVAFQYLTTRTTERLPPLLMMTLGSFVYACALGSITYLGTFSHFVIAMVVLTAGEMIINPTVTNYASNLAPEHMRARYMGMLEMVYRFALGVSPLAGGLINDLIDPSLIWLYGSVITLFGTAGFLRLHLEKSSG
jgi:MFS family permease